MNKLHKQGRNDSCACGSSKKFKQCCMLKTDASTPSFTQILKVAVAHVENGNHQSAIGICQKILQSEPDHFAAIALLGILAFYAGNSDAAIKFLNKSLSIEPKQADTHNNLGEILRITGKSQLALTHFQKALEIDSSHLGALINCGNALQDIYRYDDAIAAYIAALKVKAGHSGALSNLANIYQQLYRHQDAIATFSELLKVDPNYDWALGGKMYSQIHSCDWRDYEKNVVEITEQVSQGKRAIKVYELRPTSDDPAIELICARIFAKAMYPLEQTKKLSSMASSEKIKIAYVSADFREHPVSQLLIGVIEQHDRSMFDVIGISLGPDDGSAYRARMIDAFDIFIDVRDQSDQKIANLLRSMNITIAIDLMGYTTHARPAIFTQRAAPVQISYLGYAGTLGSNSMDYIIADDVIIPKEDEPHYAENVIRLPCPLLPRDNALPASAIVATRHSENLPEKGFVFCAFNNHYKISPYIFDVWMRLLNKAQGSVLWLSAANSTVQSNLCKEAEKRGIDSNRLIFANRTEQLEDHLSRHVLADLFLDTYPFNAHTTSSDALWSGLPVLTLKGKTFASRVASSLLQALDMPELITDSLDAYELLALDIATNPDRVCNLKAKLLHNKIITGAFDTQKYTQNLEEAFKSSVLALEGNAD